jgi:succinate dehydrogenase flavin-adding protein (antitoxin of CptAB toxin-antitoxin module)
MIRCVRIWTAEDGNSSFEEGHIDLSGGALDCSDADLFGWTIEGLAPPRQHDHDVMRLLRDFCGVRRRGH